jgi:hypothetical protein
MHAQSDDRREIGGGHQPRSLSASQQPGRGMQDRRGAVDRAQPLHADGVSVDQWNAREKENAPPPIPTIAEIATITEPNTGPVNAWPMPATPKTAPMPVET